MVSVVDYELNCNEKKSLFDLDYYAHAPSNYN